MNILSGSFKNYKIKTYKSFAYRPTKSRVRKSIFDRLQSFQFNSVLDLFSGSGIIGFESASRGATSISFVENDYKSLMLIKKNAESLIGPNYYYFQNDVFDFIKGCKQFDLIYADPPYGKYNIFQLAQDSFKKLKNQGKFFLECDKNQEPFMDCSFRDYGQTRILYWEKK